MRSRFIFPLAALSLAALPALSMAAEPSPSPAELGEKARIQLADAAFADAERSLSVRLLDKSMAQADADAALLRQVKDATDALSARLSSLKKSDDGKKLAAALDEISAEQVQRAIDEPPVLPEVLAARQREIESVETELKRLKNDPPAGFVPPDQQQDELIQASVELRGVLARVRERDTWLTSMTLSAPKDLNLEKASTLEAVLADFHARKQKDWNVAQRLGIDLAKPEELSQITESARTAELERALQQSRAMVAQTRFDIEQSKIDLEMQLKLLREQKDREVAALNQRLAESEAHRVVADAGAEATREKGRIDADKIRLQQKCQDPEVKELLAPFLADGLWQPGDRQSGAWLHDRGPVSLSALRKCGTLQKTQNGLTQLYIAGNSTYVNWNNEKHPDTERPKWGFPRATSILTQDDWQKLRHIQDLLNELGDTLVEEKMLAK